MATKKEQSDAFKFLQDQLDQWGLSSLYSTVRGWLRDGYTADRVILEIQDTQAYKQRFAGNEARRKAGLSVLDPAEYLATEEAYRQLMEQAGLPSGFYDQPSDFTNWIGNDVSPTEIQSRVESAVALVDSVDPEVRRQFERFYTKGDLVAYALDRKRTSTILQRQVQAAQLAAQAENTGFGGIGQGTAEQLAEAGVDAQQARGGFAQADVTRQAAGRLTAVYGGTYGAQEAISDVFFQDIQAANARRRLASQERAAFAGTGGLSTVGLGSSRGNV